KTIEDVIHAVSQCGIKVVMSTHDLGQARRLASEIILLHRGRVIEAGPASAFFSEPKTLEAKLFVAGELLVSGDRISCTLRQHLWLSGALRPVHPPSLM